MNDPLEIIASHDMHGNYSCVAWAVELVIKLHRPETIKKYEIQEKFPNGLGFDERFKLILKERGIDATDELLEFDELIEKGAEQFELGFPLVFAFPSGFIFDFEADAPTWRSLKHCFCAVPDRGKLRFYTRLCGNPETMFLTIAQLRKFHEKAVAIEDLAKKKTDKKIHCLRHAVP